MTEYSPSADDIKAMREVLGYTEPIQSSAEGLERVRVLQELQDALDEEKARLVATLKEQREQEDRT